MQAIITKFLGATDTHGSRVSARCEAGSVTVPYNYGVDDWNNHDTAVVELCRKFGWIGKIHVGIHPGSKGGRTYVFENDHPLIIPPNR